MLKHLQYTVTTQQSATTYKGNDMNSIASDLITNENIELNRAAEEVAVHVAVNHTGDASQTTYVFKDGSVLVTDPWRVLFSN